MKRTLILVLVSMFSSSVAFAIEVKKTAPAAATIAKAKAKCGTMYPDATSVAQVLAKGQCLLSVDLSVLERKQAAGDERVADEITNLRKQMDDLKAMIKRMDAVAKAQVKATAKRAQDESAKSKPALSAPRPPAGPPMMGAPYALIDMPGRYAAATWEMPGMETSRVKIENINFTLRYKFDLHGPSRIVVMKNGQPLAILHPSAPGAPQRFNEFFGDVGGTGKPDPVAYKGADPSFVDDVYVSYQPGDAIDIVFLVPSGKMVAVPGIPPQAMWTKLVRYRLRPPQAISRRWDMTPYLGAQVN